jgi:hypothetical protein
MKKKVVVGSGSDVPFGLLRDFFGQLAIGEETGGKRGITGAQLRAFVEHRNPYDPEELQMVLPFADEEVPTDLEYPEGFRVRSVVEQALELQRIFPQLDASHVDELSAFDLPVWADGWAVIPKPLCLAPNLFEAILLALNTLKEKQGLRVWSKIRLSPAFLNLTERTRDAYLKLDTCPGDFWVVPFNFGKRWLGHSTRNADVRLAANEFGFGPYEVAMLLLTHPDRITSSRDINIDCPGWGFRVRESEEFISVLHFSLGDFSQLDLGYSENNCADKQWGSATGFLPQ